MKIKQSKLAGVYAVSRPVIQDERGYFMPTLGSDEPDFPSPDNN